MSTPGMQALLRARDQEIASLKNSLRQAEQRRKNEAAWWTSQLRQKDDKLLFLRKALSEAQKQGEYPRRDEQAWKKEQENMEEKLKKAVEWGKVVFEEKNSEIALLHQSLQKEQDQTAKALQEMEEIKNELTEKDKRIETLTMEMQKLSSNITALQAQSSSQKEEMERQAEAMMVTCRDNNKIVNSLNVTIDCLAEKQKQWTQEKLEFEAQVTSEHETWRKERENMQDRMKKMEQTSMTKLAEKEVEVNTLCQQIESATKENAELTAAIACLSTELSEREEMETRAREAKERKGLTQFFNIFRRRKKANKERSDNV